jgi:hypothetical protein
MLVSMLHGEMNLCTHSRSNKESVILFIFIFQLSTLQLLSVAGSDAIFPTPGTPQELTYSLLIHQSESWL